MYFQDITRDYYHFRMENIPALDRESLIYPL